MRRVFVRLNSLTVAFLLVVALFVQDGRSATIDEETGLQYQGDGFDWLLGQGLFDSVSNNSGVGDKEALAVVSELFRSRDERASRALKNYIDRFPRDPAAFEIAGTDLLQTGDYKTAVEAFSYADSLAPNAPWLMSKLGAAQILSGQVDAGLMTMKETLAYDPDNPLALRYLSWDAARDGDFGAAIIYSQRALNAFGIPEGEINRAHLDLAELYHRTNQNQRLMAFLNAAVHNPNIQAPPRTTLQMYGLFYEAALREKKTDQARLAFDKLAAIGNQNSPQLIVSEARLLVAEGKPKIAVEKLEELRGRNADLAAVLIPDLAIAYARMGETDLAVEQLSALAEIRGAGADLPLFRQIVGILFSADRNEEAVSFMEARFAASADRVDVGHLLSETLLRAERPHDALKIAMAVAEQAEDSPLAQFTAALSANAVGDKVLAVSFLERSLSLDPANAQVWLTLLGVIHGHNTYGHTGDDDGDHSEVRNLLDRAIEANPASAELHYELGLLLMSEGKPEEAIIVFDDALVHAPADVPNMTLGALARADAKIDLEKADFLITLAKQLTPANTIIKDVEGWIAFQKGDISKAGRLLDEALTEEPGDETTRFHRAVLSAYEGDISSAREDLLSALTGELYVHYEQKARELLVSIAPASELKLEVHTIDGSDTGVGAQIGSIVIIGTDDGVKFLADLNGLPEGANSAHVHNRPTCAPKDGVLGGAAGMHFGHVHEETKHMMPDGTMMSGMDHGSTVVTSNAELSGSKPLIKPRGDLDPFIFDANGYSNSVVFSEQLTFDEIRGRSLMIHKGIDVDGESGPKIACVVIP